VYTSFNSPVDTTWPTNITVIKLNSCHYQHRTDG
jgi:hypothetical protein